MKNIKLSQSTISVLGKLIAGDIPKNRDKSLSPYLSGPKLVDFFNEFGANDTYPLGGGFPSRWSYVEDKLRDFNETEPISRIVEAAFAPIRFLETSFALLTAVEYLNKYLAFDGYVLIVGERRCRLQVANEAAVESESALPLRDQLSHDFIQEQLAKCDQKILSTDYDGAITNARSLVEAVLFEIEGRLDGTRPNYDGDLPKLYKRVQKLLNLDPDKGDLTPSLKEILRGLVNIISGLAPLRNKMGDAHVRTHKPERHHAKLAVNSAKTFTDFVIDSLEYQNRRGKITPE